MWVCFGPPGAYFFGSFSKNFQCWYIYIGTESLKVQPKTRTANYWLYLFTRFIVHTWPCNLKPFYSSLKVNVKKINYTVVSRAQFYHLYIYSYFCITFYIFVDAKEKCQKFLLENKKKPETKKKKHAKKEICSEWSQQYMYKQELGKEEKG